MTPLLYQFSFSHFNEKARWALDYKGVEHRRRTLLPGAHAPLMMAISGQAKTPVLALGKEIIAGSGRIIDYLERAYANPPLYPQDPVRRAEALEIQAWFDKDVGPATRRATFYELLRDPLYVSRVFALDNGFGRCLYLGTYPLLAGFLAVQENITPSAAAKARETTANALDYVALKAGESGYLVGDAFSVADMTAASLLAVVVMPPEFVFPGRDPRPASVEKWVAHWADHPGSAWVRLMFERHRGTSGEALAGAA